MVFQYFFNLQSTIVFFFYSFVMVDIFYKKKKDMDSENTSRSERGIFQYQTC